MTGHDWDRLLTCQRVGVYRKPSDGLEWQQHPQRVFSKEILRCTGHGPRAHTPAWPMRREDCGHYLLSLSAPGGLIKGVQSQIVSWPWPKQQCRVESVRCKMLWGQRTGTVIIVGQTEPLFLAEPPGRKIEPSPLILLEKGNICKTGLAGLTNSKGHSKNEIVRLTPKRTHFELPTEIKYTGS